MNGELIDDLPFDTTTTHTTDQMQVANMLFKDNNETTLNVLAKEMRDGIIICMLFILFDLPYINELIRKLVPAANGSYLILTGIKSVAVVVLYYLFKNFSLAKKDRSNN